MRTNAGPRGYFAQAWHTSVNWLLYTVTLGRYLWLEGRRSGSKWHNWTHGQTHSVLPYLLPTSEEEIVQAVRRHPRLRVVGAGHSFNAAVVSQTTMSLDAYTGILEVDEAGKRVRVRGGTRIRDMSRALLERGWAIVALPSHDAQSASGILSTDVHGTGRTVGFVSQSVVHLRIVDGLGRVHDVGPEDVLFQAAIGGIGAVGIIVEVTFQCVDAFHIRQKTVRLPRARAEAELQSLLQQHDHTSFYVFPFSRHVQVHTWDHTSERKSKLAFLREWLNISFAALSAAWVGDLLAATKLFPSLSEVVLRTQRNSELVMQSHEGFNRTIYHLHQELEFAVDVERVWEVTDHLIRLYEDLYRRQRMPFTLLELRFTPGGHEKSLISPGAGDRPQVYVNLVCNQSGAFDEYYRRTEEYMREIGAKPHLGKWCESLNHRDLAATHGDRFERFRSARAEHDPEGRFRNPFLDRVFGSIGERTDLLLEPLTFPSGLTVKNRVIRSSVGGRFDNYDGTGTQARLNWEERFAQGGVGAIISAFCAVSPEGAHVPNFATIEDDERVPFWSEVGRRVHAHDCRFLLQLHHCGRQRDLASLRVPPSKAMSATDRSDPLNGFPARAMTLEEIRDVVRDFTAGARRARDAGLDGIEIHAANGYLLSQFLSSAINDRNDGYGGSIENRARLLTEILESIRREVGDDWHVQVKLNAEDRNDAVLPWLANGNGVEDAIAIAKLAVAAGADAIHLSSGSAFPHPHNPPGPLPLELVKSTYDTMLSEGRRAFYNYLLLRYRPTRWLYRRLWSRTQPEDIEASLAPLAARFKAAVEVPVIVTGGFQRASRVRSVLENGEADAVSIARPLVANSDLVRWFERGRELPPRPCTFCNRCLAYMLEHPMGCYEPERFDGSHERMMESVLSVYRPTAWDEARESVAEGPV